MEYTKGERLLSYGEDKWYVFIKAKPNRPDKVVGRFTKKEDALLDAAAPALYEALKVAEARIFTEIRHHPEAGDYRETLQNELRQVMAVLAEAEGK